MAAYVLGHLWSFRLEHNSNRVRRMCPHVLYPPQSFCARTRSYCRGMVKA